MLDTPPEKRSPGAGNTGAASLAIAYTHASPSIRHEQATGRALGAALARWADARNIALMLRYQLDPERRLLLAGAALWSLDAEVREELAGAALSDLRAGSPVPPFDSVKEEAELWASYASPLEVKHYLIACWNALSPEDRQRFLRVAI